MWCEHCQSEVAAEFAADGHSLFCTACRQPLKSVMAGSLHPETQSARDFLERWSREQQRQHAEQSPALSNEQEVDEASEGFEYTLAAARQAESAPLLPRIEQPAAQQPPQEMAPAARPKFRVDAEHTSPAGPRAGKVGPPRPRHLQKKLETVGAGSPPPAAPPVAEAHEPPRPRRTRVDAEHQSYAPHFDTRVGAPVATKTPGRSEAMWGQLLAYLGVGALTGGAVLVLWGYFGGIESYASTGWLVTTAGQMVLLLGIVTLVGGGMQQTTHEVTQRIEHLGGRMIRIEQSTDKILKGPYYARNRKRSRAKIRESAGDESEAG